MKHRRMRSWVLAVVASTGAMTAGADQIKVATWNLAWLANDPISSMDLVKDCQKQDEAKVDFDKRTPEGCRKGSPYRMAGAYAGLAHHVKWLDFDIIGMQEVQSADAAKLILGDRPIASGDPKSMVAPGTYKVVVNPDGGWQKVGLAVKTALLAPGQDLIAEPFTEIGVPVKRDHRSALDVKVPLKTGTLRVLVVHLKSACHRVPLDAASDDCQQLSAQAPILQNWIRQRQEEGKPFLVLGDFNRVLASSAQHEQCGTGVVCTKVSLRASLDGNAVDQLPILIPTADAKHVPECGFKGDLNLIDHILLGGGAEAAYIANSVRSHAYIDKDGKPITKDKVRHLSDHCPVSIGVNL